jgi:hypothetical protein
MGSSVKKKRDKKRDFQKPKLKVGKSRPKADNFTDTSFKAKCKLQSSRESRICTLSDGLVFEDVLWIYVVELVLI